MKKEKTRKCSKVIAVLALVLAVTCTVQFALPSYAENATQPSNTGQTEQNIQQSTGEKTNQNIEINSDQNDQNALSIPQNNASNPQNTSSPYANSYNMGKLTTKDFSGKRLMVATNDKNSIVDKATILDDLNGVYLLQFSTAKEAYQAYGYYKEKGFDFVDIDKNVSAADIFSSKTNTPKSTDSSSAKNMTSDNNPFAEVKEEAKTKNADIALIDTGAKGDNVKKSVSVIGTDPSDDSGHGTLMAKTIDDIAPKADILSIKVLGEDGKGTMSSVYAGMEYAIDSNVKIINLSLSGVKSAESTSIEKAVEDAKAKGITVVGAAGNDGNNAKYYTPGSIDDAVIVGACDKNKQRQDFSNYGKTVDGYNIANSTSEAAAKSSAYLFKEKPTWEYNLKTDNSKETVPSEGDGLVEAAAAYLSLSTSVTSNTDSQYTVRVTLYYHGNGMSWSNYQKSWNISATGQSNRSGTHSFSKSTGAQELGSTSFTWSKGSSAQTKSISASFATGVSIGTLHTSTSITVPAVQKYFYIL